MKYRMIRFTLLLTIIFTLGACAPLPNIIPQTSSPQADYDALPQDQDIEHANNLLAEGKKREAASAYFAASNNYRSPQRERLILQAAELAAIFKDTDLAQRYLSPVSYASLNTENQARFRFVQAQLALNDNSYGETLRILPQRVSGLPKGLASKILNARMAAAQSSGDKFLLVQELILQENGLKNNYEVTLNHDRIWNHIKQMPLQEIDKGRKTTNHPVLKSWLVLGYLAQRGQADKELLGQQLNDWKQRNPGHPGNNKISQILRTTSTAKITPYLGGVKPVKPNQTANQSTRQPSTSNGSKQIAVILPLTGKLSGIGNTLLKGIQEAQQQFTGNTDLKVYNSSTSSIEGIYQTAINKGADFVIGPFDKTKIANLARGNLPVPTLGLNYVSASANNFYQFGLSPEDEAVQMAQYVLNKGQRRVALLTPDSAWGRRLQTAIRTSVIERGGKIAFMESFINNGVNFQSVANELARRNREIDAILIAASPTQARRLFPALRQTVSLPVYATSHVFNGIANPGQDAILGGLIFTETPWILDMLRQELTPKSSYPRLHAMGMDALLIATDFNKLKSFGNSFKGKTGKIRLSSDGTLHRTLRWAQFKNGIPVPY